MKTETRNILGATAPDSSRIIADHLLSGILARELTAAYLAALLRARCTDAADQGAALAAFSCGLLVRQRTCLPLKGPSPVILRLCFWGRAGGRLQHPVKVPSAAMTASCVGRRPLGWYQILRGVTVM